MLIRRDFVAWSLSAVVALPPIGAIAPFWDMQCVGIDPTISPGASSTVVGRCAGSILFFFDHSATRAKFHDNQSGTSSRFGMMEYWNSGKMGLWYCNIGQMGKLNLPM